MATGIRHQIFNYMLINNEKHSRRVTIPEYYLS